MRDETVLANWLGRLRSVASFAWSKQHKVILTALLAVGVMLFWTAPWSTEPRTQWWNAGEPILGMATLAVAILIWFSETVEAWEHTLPKRLKVIYVYGDRPAMVCEDAVLIAESDIRSWALQMGQQMNENKQLSIGPRLELLPPRLETRPGGVLVRAYELRIELTSLPDIVQRRREAENSPTLVLVRKVGKPDTFQPTYELTPPFGV